MKQRRDSYRISFPLETRYLILPEPDPQFAKQDQFALIEPDDPNWKDGMISDISGGGARLHGRFQAGAGSLIGMTFTPPSEFLEAFAARADEREYGPNGPRVKIVEVKPKDFRELSIRGHVVNVSLNTHTKAFVHNIQFFKVRPGDRDEIERFINMRQRYELKARRI